MNTFCKRVLWLSIIGLLMTSALVAEEQDFRNGSFEQDLQGWKTGTFSSWTLPQITIDTAGTDRDGKAVKLSAPDKNTRGWVEQRFTVQPDTVYAIEASLKSRNVSYNRMGIQVIEYPANSDKARTLDIKKTLPMQITKNTQDWLPYRAVIKTGPSTATLTLRVYLGTHGPVQKGAEAWADGLSITRHDSAATVNLLSNADFEGKAPSSNACWQDGFEPAHWTLWTAKKSKGLKACIDAAEKHKGMRSVRFEMPSKIRFALHSTTAIDSTKKYHFSAALKTENIEGSVYVRIMYLNAENKQIKGKLPTTHILRGTNDWAEYTLPLAPPSDAAKIKVECFGDNASGTVWFNSCTLNEVPE